MRSKKVKNQKNKKNINVLSLIIKFMIVNYFPHSSNYFFLIVNLNLVCVHFFVEFGFILCAEKRFYGNLGLLFFAEIDSYHLIGYMI